MLPMKFRMLAVTAACLACTLWTTSCGTTLNHRQRQELETKVYAAPMKGVYSAARDTIVNRSYQVENSDYRGGVLTFERKDLTHNATLAASLSLLCPTIGDFYMERYGWGIFDGLLWPFSLVWAVPSNYRMATRRTRLVQGTISFERLGKQKTRTRISIAGMGWDAETYPVVIRDLQEEIARQLFLKGTAAAD